MGVGKCRSGGKLCCISALFSPCGAARVSRRTSSAVKLLQFLAEGKERREVIMVYDSGEGSQVLRGAGKHENPQITQRFTTDEANGSYKHTNADTRNTHKHTEHSTHSIPQGRFKRAIFLFLFLLDVIIMPCPSFHPHP